jgi:hypothetical protein
VLSSKFINAYFEPQTSRNNLEINTIKKVLRATGHFPHIAVGQRVSSQHHSHLFISEYPKLLPMMDYLSNPNSFRECSLSFSLTCKFQPPQHPSFSVNGVVPAWNVPSEAIILALSGPKQSP